MEKTAIKIEHVYKEYRLGAIGGGTLRGDLQSWMARIRGKEDPNSKIGTDTGMHNGDRFLALEDVSFSVRQGEAVGIIGHNGAGKSTLLKLLSRVTAPTKGTISYNGRIASMLEVGTGFHPELTGRENVYMNGAILGMTKAEIDKKFDQIVEFAEMEKFIETPVKRYSSGMYVKLAFSVAAHLDSEIMIMDEVLAVGDMAFQKKCLDKMRNAAQEEGRTVLYVSHNMNTIRQLCTRCIVLDHGHVIFNGDTEKAIDVYMGSNTAFNKCIYTENIPREPEFRNGSVRIIRISSDYLSGKVPVGNEMTVHLMLQSNRTVSGINCRVILKSGDSLPVSMFASAKGVDLLEGKKYNIDIPLDISRVAPGRYTLGFVVYQLDEFGNDFYLDGLKEVYSFDVEASVGFNRNMEWKSRYWGHMYSEPVEMEIEGQ